MESVYQVYVSLSFSTATTRINFRTSSSNHVVRTPPPPIITTSEAPHDAAAAALGSTINDDEEYDLSSVFNAFSPPDTPALGSFIDSLKSPPMRADTTNNTDESVCSICMEDLTPLTKYNNDDMARFYQVLKIPPICHIKELPCGHCFHKHCIVQWLHRKNTCPLCRYQCPPAPANSSSMPTRPSSLAIAFAAATRGSDSDSDSESDLPINHTTNGQRIRGLVDEDGDTIMMEYL